MFARLTMSVIGAVCVLAVLAIMLIGVAIGFVGLVACRRIDECDDDC